MPLVQKEVKGYIDALAVRARRAMRNERCIVVSFVFGGLGAIGWRCCEGVVDARAGMRVEGGADVL